MQTTTIARRSSRVTLTDFPSLDTIHDSRHKYECVTVKLAPPVAFESTGPFVQRSDGLGLRAIKQLTPVAPRFDEPNAEQDTQML
jgi:hypothetical protein